MMSNNKILTVSYGTFSCTLEGFEDSFDTMKAIAEYFRDLAADDRYFGAEPPQPDAEMLTRIAEREISRRVEARASESGIHLRAGAAAALTTGAPMTDAQEPRPAQAPTEAAAQETEVAAQSAAIDRNDAPAEGPVDETDTAEAPMASMAPQSDEDEAGISDAVTRTVSMHGVKADPNQSIPSIAERPRQDHSAQDLATPVAEQADAAQTEDDSEEDGTVWDFPADVAEVPVAEDVPAARSRPAPNSIADKLQRIRAVVARSPAAPQAYSEDEHAEEIVDEGYSDNAIQIAEFFARKPGTYIGRTDTPAHDKLPEPVAREVEEDADRYDDAGEDDIEDEDAALMARLATIGTEFDVGESTDEAAADPDLDAVAESDTPETVADTAELDADTSDLPWDDPALAGPASDPEAQALPDAEIDLTPEVPVGERDDTAMRARVIKVKRSDIVAALESGLLEEDDADSFDPDGDALDATAGADADPAAAQGPDRADSDTSDVRQLGDVAAADEDELDRLMAEANHKMEEPEANSRRAAFSHLRGAVEATLADGDLGTDAGTDDNDYRTDLAAVKPRRPVAGVRTDRPRDQRPAPLKLVAAQRVDVPSASTGPVSPRRVAAAPIAEPSETDGSFADYAASRGAHDLPELLEAAASYLSFVEGHDQFSRPQLMTKVRQLDPDGFSREDGLRHFGKLLRAGKIEKIKGGRFTVSADIGFRPDGKRAAG